MKKSGFTLIELSIVLVIVGLLVAGVLVGKDMIAAAETRSLIAQMEKFQTAVNTFRGKYNCLPGDCADAAKYGLPARGPYQGEGDGNGLLEGIYSHAASSAYGLGHAAGENVMFWVDLSTAGLIEENFSTATSTTIPGADITATSTPGLKDYLPRAKAAKNSYIYVYNDSCYCTGPWHSLGPNYFGISAVSIIQAASYYGYIDSTPLMPVYVAYGMDTKIDDGSPLTGAVIAKYLNGINDVKWVGASDTSATAYSTSTCYDNGNSAGAAQRYSMANSNGANCALSVRFQ